MDSTLDVLNFLCHQRFPERSPRSRVRRAGPFLSLGINALHLQNGQNHQRASLPGLVGAQWEWPHSLMQQADTQVPAAVGATAEGELGVASAAGLHSDGGLGLHLHAHLHNALEQGPAGDSAQRCEHHSNSRLEQTCCPFLPSGSLTSLLRLLFWVLLISPFLLFLTPACPSLCYLIPLLV